MPPLPPGCLQTVWGDDERFVKTYFGTFRDRYVYSTFDWATCPGSVEWRVHKLALHALNPSHSYPEGK